MGINRKQLSLIIRDDELFINFIKPYADNGELNNVIIRCLSSYYYNEKVRDLIDDVQQEANSDTVQVKSTQDAINDIRQALAMQSFYAESLQDEMNAGIEDMTAILQRTTEKAEEDGLVKTEQSESGNTVARITMKTKVSSGEIADFAKLQENMLASAQHGDYSGAFEASAKMQTELADKLNMIISLLQSGQGGNIDLSNITSTVSQNEVHSTTVSSDVAFAPDDDSVTLQKGQDVQTVKQAPVVEVPISTPVMEKEEVITPEPVKEEPIDGSDAIGDLLSSIEW